MAVTECRRNAQIQVVAHARKLAERSVIVKKLHAKICHVDTPAAEKPRCALLVCNRTFPRLGALLHMPSSQQLN